MPVNLVINEDGTMLLLDGVVTAEETDQFVNWLKEYPKVTIDMSACEHLHTALLQALLVLQPRISAMPVDPFWSRCIPISVNETKIEKEETS